LGDQRIFGKSIIVLKKRLALSLERAGGANRSLIPFQREVKIIRRQRKKKKRCIPAIQQGERFPFFAGGGIGTISPFLFSREAERKTAPFLRGGYAGRSENGACFGR